MLREYVRVLMIFGASLALAVIVVVGSRIFGTYRFTSLEWD